MRLVLTYSIFMTVYVGLSAIAQSAPQDIAGTYKGIIWSNSDRPGRTTFRVSANGKITGTYTFQDAAGPENGRLLDCKLNGRKLICVWEDIHGSGDWYGLFAAGYKSFKGGWFDDLGDFKRLGGKRGHRWDGTRR